MSTRIAVNHTWTRRRLLQTSLVSAFGCACTGLASAQGEAVSESPGAERLLMLFNTHTRETVRAVYRRGQAYDGVALDQLRNVLRDHRSGHSHEIDPSLYDQLHELARAAGREPHFEIISGYRSPESNAKMAAASTGVAKKSLHMQGRAIDVRLRGYSCADLRDLALKAQKGGVGYYQRSDFVHLDTGRFRTWVG
jgi:uncharacterized protein YcbK (DUF882 family)